MGATPASPVLSFDLWYYFAIILGDYDLIPAVLLVAMLINN